MEQLPAIIDYPDGISVIDARYHRPGRAAIHLITEGNKAALVDTGTRFSVPGIMAVLAHKQIAPEQIDYIFLTHIHLDHAGGAGEFMQQLPNARLVVHPRGASHMVNPMKLIAGVMAVYGESEFRRIYGEIQPISAERIIEAPDDTLIKLNGRPLRLLDTPGHARHHYCIHDAGSASIFTGDTFGVSYREFDANGLEFVFPTTSPVQFDPEAAHASINRLMALRPEQAFLTHYGHIRNLPHHASQMHALIDAFVGIVQQAAEIPDRQPFIVKALQDLLWERLITHGCTLTRDAVLSILQTDIRLNARGLEIWLEQTLRQPGQAAG
ncbi:Glyoxylase, beta-lactamase superfamily II [Nitrosomonas eutropha]|uniref:MBL fold metallo-hydrolase n=1 Tax=Nitrosomonas TaxID=914 RepID=UPI000899D3A6|nr:MULTISPECIES: MBL fold metallo-hydrolase [Nitrosomonas]MXS79313.1 MBL fold metallo-hydrolase [Nitrosomonas sp. GH22]SDW91547.1 Glyoxylase, beta-lactamase superfamily II [Nitrosomonas eutropha]